MIQLILIAIGLSFSCTIAFGQEKEITNSIGMKLVLISKGTFKMGSPPSEEDSEDDERQHVVTLTEDYYLASLEVTQEQYRTVIGENPSFFQGDRVAERHPKTGRVVNDVDTSGCAVEQISWEEAVEFCARLSSSPEEKAAGRVYRLPTEAEWEFACRAGTGTAYNFGDSSRLLGDYAWYGKNSRSKTEICGKKEPNAWGLYDMHGNVLEWCNDWYGAYPKGAVTDPKGPRTGSARVCRGGQFRSDPAECRSANRFKYNLAYTGEFNGNNIGFRVALSCPQNHKQAGR